MKDELRITSHWRHCSLKARQAVLYRHCPGALSTVRKLGIRALLPGALSSVQVLFKAPCRTLSRTLLRALSRVSCPMAWTLLYSVQLRPESSTPVQHIVRWLRSCPVSSKLTEGSSPVQPSVRTLRSCPANCPRNHLLSSTLFESSTPVQYTDKWFFSCLAPCPTAWLLSCSLSESSTPLYSTLSQALSV